VPTYQYACTECGDQLEAVQSFSDPALVECPACAGRLRKVFNSVGVVFKGSGFYRTDSRNGAKAAATNGSGGEQAATSEAKPKPSSDASSKASASTSSGSSSGTAAAA
jgi:putative FmdB family regulatory protein